MSGKFPQGRGRQSGQPHTRSRPVAAAQPPIPAAGPWGLRGWPPHVALCSPGLSRGCAHVALAVRCRLRGAADIFHTRYNRYIGWSSMEDNHTDTIPIHEVQYRPIYRYGPKGNHCICRYSLSRLWLVATPSPGSLPSCDSLPPPVQAR